MCRVNSYNNNNNNVTEFRKDSPPLPFPVTRQTQQQVYITYKYRVLCSIISHGILSCGGRQQSEKIDRRRQAVSERSTQRWTSGRETWKTAIMVAGKQEIASGERERGAENRDEAVAEKSSWKFGKLFNLSVMLLSNLNPC
jgi:hypothetical protein